MTYFDPYFRDFRSQLKCNWAQKIIYSIELQSHWLEAKAAGADSPASVLGDAKAIADRFNIMMRPWFYVNRGLLLVICLPFLLSLLMFLPNRKDVLDWDKQDATLVWSHYGPVNRNFWEWRQQAGVGSGEPKVDLKPTSDVPPQLLARVGTLQSLPNVVVAEGNPGRRESIAHSGFLYYCQNVSRCVRADTYYYVDYWPLWRKSWRIWSQNTDHLGTGPGYIFVEMRHVFNRHLYMRTAIRIDRFTLAGEVADSKTISFNEMDDPEDSFAYSVLLATVALVPVLLYHVILLLYLLVIFSASLVSRTLRGLRA